MAETVRPHIQEACAQMREASAGLPKSGDAADDPCGYALDADLLEGVGEALFGRNWKTELAEAMGWSDPSRVRAMMRGERPIPERATREAILLLEGRIATCRAMIEEIREAGPDRATGEAAE